MSHRRIKWRSRRGKSSKSSKSVRKSKKKRYSLSTRFLEMKKLQKDFSTWCKTHKDPDCPKHLRQKKKSGHKK